MLPGMQELPELETFLMENDVTDTPRAINNSVYRYKGTSANKSLTQVRQVIVKMVLTCYLSTFYLPVPLV
jgi:hypothetical protein